MNTNESFIRDLNTELLTAKKAVKAAQNKNASVVVQQEKVGSQQIAPNPNPESLSPNP